MKIGVFGKTSIEDEGVGKKCIDIGKFIAETNNIVVTGGTNGYPNLVSESVLKHGGKSFVYAVGLNQNDHKTYHNIDLSKHSKIIFQKKYGKEKLSNYDNYIRSLNMCNDVDIAIIIGGRVGTMYELTILSGLGKDIYVLDNSGGITGQTIKNFIKEGHKSKGKITFFNTIEDLKRKINN